MATWRVVPVGSLGTALMTGTAVSLGLPAQIAAVYEMLIMKTLNCVETERSAYLAVGRRIC